MIPKISILPGFISAPVLMWADLDAGQKEQAAKKYFPGVGEEWESAGEFFSYEPDGFIIVDGEVFDIDAEATAIPASHYSSERVLLDGCAPGFTARYLPSSDNGERVLFIRYAVNLPNSVIHVFNVEVPNV